MVRQEEEDEEKGATRRQRGFGGRAAVLFICIILVSSQLCLSCALLRYHRCQQDFRPVWSPPRKFRFLESYPAAVRPNIPPAGAIGDPDPAIYADDKRVVRTGPNPLHN